MTIEKPIQEQVIRMMDQIKKKNNYEPVVPSVTEGEVLMLPSEVPILPRVLTR